FTIIGTPKNSYKHNLTEGFCSIYILLCVCVCVCVCVEPALWSSAQPVYFPQARGPGGHGAVSSIRSPCPTGAKAGLILLLLSVGSHFGTYLACVHLHF